MWMHYASQDWVKAEDIDSAIERMGCELNCMSFDRLHAANYDLNYCYFEEEVKRLSEESEMYNNGSSLCTKYAQGLLSLDQFCEKMVEIKLKSYLRACLLEYLPAELAEKYKLKDYQDEDVDTTYSEDNQGEYKETDDSQMSTSD